MVVCGDDGLAHRLAAQLRNVYEEQVTLVVPPTARVAQRPVVGRARAAAALLDRVSAVVNRAAGAAVDVLVIWSVAAVAVAGQAALVWRTFRGVRRIVDRMDDLVDDWHGVPERPGVPGRLGVMARLRQIAVRLTSVEHELQPPIAGSR